MYVAGHVVAECGVHELMLLHERQPLERGRDDLGLEVFLVAGVVLDDGGAVGESGLDEGADPVGLRPG